MADRETMLLNAIEKMTSQYSVYYVDEAVSRLMSDEDMPDRERMLLAALVEMVDKCLDRYDDVRTGTTTSSIPSRCLPANMPWQRLRILG